MLPRIRLYIVALKSLQEVFGQSDEGDHHGKEIESPDVKWQPAGKGKIGIPETEEHAWTNFI